MVILMYFHGVGENPLDTTQLRKLLWGEVSYVNELGGDIRIYYVTVP